MELFHWFYSRFQIIDMGQKRIIIVHGFASSPKMYWFPWLKNELEKAGHQVEAPQMPSPFTPKIEEWVPFLSKVVGTPDENTFFIGHSIGCQSIIRYLETLPQKSKVGGAIFVAPFIVLPNLEKNVVKPWVENSIDFEKVRKILPKSTAIFSEDDPLIPIENKKHFENKLNSKIISLVGFNHFVTIIKLPVVLEEINKML